MQFFFRASRKIFVVCILNILFCVLFQSLLAHIETEAMQYQVLQISFFKIWITVNLFLFLQTSVQDAIHQIDSDNDGVVTKEEVIYPFGFFIFVDLTLIFETLLLQMRIASKLLKYQSQSLQDYAY